MPFLNPALNDRRAIGRPRGVAKHTTPSHLLGAALQVGALLFTLCGAGGVQGSMVAQAATPADTGLAQRLRQQLSSECYGFVDHDPEQIRGYGVNEAFQLTRDTYPWARFEDTPNLLVQRQEVLVGGSAHACGDVIPGGTVNLKTRRVLGMPSRAVLVANQFGRSSVLGEGLVLSGDTVQWRAAVRREQGSNHLRHRMAVADLATQLDIRPQSGRLFRLDLEFREGNEPSGVAWPLDLAIPLNANRRTSLEQDWSRYRHRQQSLLLAWEEDLGPSTRLKLGHSRVRYQAQWDDLFLTPLGNPAFPPAFRVDVHRVPRGQAHYDAWHAAVEQEFKVWEATHLTRAYLSRIEVSEPDRRFPLQGVEPWVPTQRLDAPPVLAATAQRRLNSLESRLGISHTADWQHWQLNAGLRGTRFADSNTVERIEAIGWAPIISMAWKPTPAWRIQSTHARGQTGRQFASLTSSTPDRLQPPGDSREDELGVRWQAQGWQVGVAAFAISRPYRFERQNVSIWRGSQEHRGYEATVGWSAPDERMRVVFNGQSISARVIGTGEPTLDGKRPPGIPDRRGTLYAEWKQVNGSPWSVNLLGEYLSGRMTLDDNRVVAPGYSRWDAGLERRVAVNRLPINLAFTVRNLMDAQAWEWVGGGVGYLMAPRTLSVTISTAL